MKLKIFKLKTNFITLVIMLISVSLEASPVNSNNIDNLHTLRSEQNSVQNQDSLPKGVSQDWLNSLRDENGKRIIPQEPETDAPIPTLFNGITANSFFGTSVSDAGDVNGDGYSDIIIGALNYSSGTGRAYIFYGGVNINTTPDVTLTGETTFNYFSTSVSGGGDVNGDGYSDVIVGAYGYSSNKGRAYIYYGSSAMNNVADVIFTGEAAGNQFGISVSNDGDVNGDGYSDVVIGASAYSSNTGRTYIYFGSTLMNNVADIIFTGEAIDNNFGYSVSTAGDVNGDSISDVIVGAYGYSTYTGRAYIFFGGVSMNNIADVTMTGESANNDFGFNVSNAGDVNDDGYSDIIIGARGFSTSTGRAYVFYGGSTMNNSADVIMTGESTNNYFGEALSAAGDINGDGYSDVIVGAWGYSSNTGRAYVYFGSQTMNNAADITLNGEGNRYGYAVSTCGDVNGDGNSEVIVGNYGYNSFTGRAYVYDYSGTGEIAYDINMTGELTNSAFGVSVSSAGDVNGDGFSDVIVGAHGYSSNKGRAYIFYGGTPMNNVADVTMTGEASANLFGLSVSTAGDVNGDGYSDVIVGAYGYSTYTGRAYIFFGGSSMNNTPDVILNGEFSNTFFGESVSTAGDVNGDGFSDVIVGAYGYLTNRGRAYIYFGGVSMNNVVDVTVTGEAVNNYFGSTVSDAGDVNGDSYSDIIVGASGYNSNSGRAYIYLGGTLMDNVADLNINGSQTGLFLGESVSGAGDVNGDGFSDVIAGAYGYSSNTGRAYIYYGGSSMNNIEDVTMTGEAASNRFGNSVSTAGDVNGDGFSDVIVGAYNFLSTLGRAYIFYGGLSMNNSADFIMTGETTFNYFGSSVSDAGDVNGDGYPDVIVGATGYSSNTGRSYIFLSPAVSDKININLVVFIQGFYDAGSNSQVSDTITAYLRNNNSPYNSIDSTKSIVSTNGISSLKFSNAQTGTYYLAIKHRNSIETWSSTGILLRRVLAPADYDFSPSSSQAFGNNQIQVDTSPNRFAIFNGDVNQDEIVDLGDIISVFNDASNFITGYVPTDVDGDNSVDLSDITLTFNNSNNFVSVIKP